MSKIRDLLWFEATRRRAFRKGPKGLPHAKKIAEATGVHPSTIQRILREERNISDDGDDRSRALQDYRPSAQLEEGLIRWLGLKDREELWGHIENAPAAPAAPRATTPKKRTRPRAK